MSTKDNETRGGKDLFPILIAHGKSVAAAGRIAGVSRATAYRWAKEPEVRERVQEIRSETLAEAAGSLAASATEAAQALRRLLHSHNEGIVLAAARSILAAAVQIREAVELEERLQRIEALLPSED